VLRTFYLVLREPEQRFFAAAVRRACSSAG
jgi:hypothetical protein